MSTFTNRLVVVGVAASVAALTLVTPAAEAATCQARNVSSGGVAAADLQAAIDSADPGDTLHVQGLCTGGFVIDKDLRLSREPGADNAILDGGGVSTVLTITGTKTDPVTVRLHGLRITHGSAVKGGGVHSSHANLQIRHATVTGNQATEVGGGGISSTGSLTLADTRVVANVAVEPTPWRWGTSMGGGVFSRGRLILKRHTAIIQNQAHDGGGVLAFGHVRLLGRAEVARNTGGGIASWSAFTLRMNDRSSATGNTASKGGGILARRVVMNDRARISGNTATEYGGGIVADSVTMNDHARILRNTAPRGGGVYGGGYESTFNVAVRMNGSSRIASNTARQTGGGICSGWGDVILRGTAAVTGNVARVTGGGVLSYASLREDVGRVIVRQDAKLSHNNPNNTAKRIRSVC